MEDSDVEDDDVIGDEEDDVKNDDGEEVCSRNALQHVRRAAPSGY